jgi:hypothetical protein
MKIGQDGLAVAFLPTPDQLIDQSACPCDLSKPRRFPPVKLLIPVDSRGRQTGRKLATFLSFWSE